MKSNIDWFLNRVLYSFYNLIYLSGLPIYATVELLVQRPLYCLHLVINIFIIYYGPQAFDIVSRHLIIVVASGIVPSWIICELLYWKNNRYLNYFAAFKKEGKKKKIVWTVGTTLALCLLIVANFMLMRYYAFLYCWILFLVMI